MKMRSNYCNQSLLEQATKLAGALSNSQTRGKFGETQLEILLESAGLIEGVHFERQESSRSDSADISRPDITIAIPGGSQIFIDSKFPFHRFLEAVDMEDPDARADAMALHAKDLLKHVDSLAKRDYQGVSNSPGPSCSSSSVTIVIECWYACACEMGAIVKARARANPARNLGMSLIYYLLH